MPLAEANSAHWRQSLWPQPFVRAISSGVKCASSMIAAAPRANVGERLVERRVAELVIGRVDEIAGRALDPVREAAARMIQRQRADLESRRLTASPPATICTLGLFGRCS